MLRPASPLSGLFLVAFVLLLLSTLSTPVIKAIPIGSFNGTDFGVWGYCAADTCSKIEIGYDTANLFRDSSDFTLAPATRHSVSYILIVHPIATFLALVCFGLAVSAHFHSPAHSPRFLLGLFILTIPTFLASLLAFLVDILLFIPHVSWGGWIVLAATIILIIASLVTCGMRRTLVSRKARRKRIQENAEMSGENYFNNLGAKREADAAVASLPRAESPPPLSGNSTAPLNDRAPFAFGAYESKPASTMDDRVPLNSSSALPATTAGGAAGYGEPMRSRQGSQSRGVGTDQYGNSLPPMISAGRRPSMESNGSERSYYSRGGRGGFPPGRGGYLPGRGGYPGPMRGGPQGGMRGPPPPGFRGDRGGPGRPPPGYGPQDRYSPAPYGDPRAGGASLDSPIGQAIEMDANAGVASPTRSPTHTGPNEAEYLPPRAQWNQNPAATPPVLNNSNRALSPIAASPIDSGSHYPSQRQTRSASGSYYEDVDPRFAESAAPQPPPIASALPPTLIAGPAHHHRIMAATSNPNYDPAHLHPSPPQHSDLTDLRQESQESLQEGQRSPAASDASHFTSVSQRGINPNWRPPPGGIMRGPPPTSQGGGITGQQGALRRDNDMLLNSNPDFALPGMGPPGPRARGGGVGSGGGFRGRGGAGMGPGRQSPNVGMSGGPNSGGGLGQPSRYPMS